MAKADEWEWVDEVAAGKDTGSGMGRDRDRDKAPLRPRAVSARPASHAPLAVAGVKRPRGGGGGRSDGDSETQEGPHAKPKPKRGRLDSVLWHGDEDDAAAPGSALVGKGKGKGKCTPPSLPLSHTLWTCPFAGAEGAKKPAYDGALSEADVALLQNFAPLYKAWGYRVRGAGHAHFEDRTHYGALPFLQKFTDGLFRPLQQVDAGLRTVRYADTVSKARTAADHPLDDENRAAWDGAAALLCEYLAVPGVAEQMVALASMRGRADSPSIAVLVLAARGILLLANGAYEAAQAVARCTWNTWRYDDDGAAS